MENNKTTDENQSKVGLVEEEEVGEDGDDEEDEAASNEKFSFLVQYNELEKYFINYSSSPSLFEIHKLAIQINISSEILEKWFIERKNLNTELISLEISQEEKLLRIQEFHENRIKRMEHDDRLIKEEKLKITQNLPSILLNNKSQNSKKRRYFHKQPKLPTTANHPLSKKYECASRKQFEDLSDFFEKVSIYPSEIQFKEMAKKLDLSEKYLKKWFAKKRLMKLKDLANRNRQQEKILLV